MTKLEERAEAYKNAAKHIKSDRVLNLASIWTPVIVQDSGFKMSEAMFDYDKLEQAVYKFHDKYQFDFYMDFCNRNPLRISSALGNTDYIIDDENGALGYATDINYMQPEDYDMILENYDEFIWTKYLNKRYQKLNSGDAIKMMSDAAKEVIAFNHYAVKINTEMAKRDVPPALLMGIPGYFNFYEILYLSLRGLRGLSVDMRRIPDKVKKLCDTMKNGNGFNQYMATAKKGTNPLSGADFAFYLLGHNILSKKQFEEFYWPSLKEVFDFAEKYDKIVHLFVESENSRFYEFFAQAPKGHVVAHFENDNLFEAKKQIGDKICFCGGMPVDLLARGTKKECVDYAKHLIDELAADGGFIFSQNKMVAYPSDYNPENLLAVNEFVREYRI